MMKVITFSANTSWYLFNFRASSLKRLVEIGYRVVCLSPEDKYSRMLVDELGCEWRALQMDNQGANPLSDLGIVLQFLRHYRELRPDATLHFTIKNNVYGTWASRLLGVPAINNISGLGTAFIHGGLVARMVRLLYRTSQPLAHRIFVQNEEDRQLLLRSGLVPADRLELLPGSGVDIRRFRTELLEPHGGEFRFLYAGRMLADKGLGELVAAFRKLRSRGAQCTLWLSGFTEVANSSAFSESDLRRWSQEPGIKWLGSSDVMEEVYAQVDCVVLASYREGMPRSLLEAGAMGLPVIAADTPGCRQVVRHLQNGLLCEARSEDALLNAMEHMLTLSPLQRAQLGEAGRKHVVENFDEDLVVAATLKAIESALSK